MRPAATPVTRLLPASIPLEVTEGAACTAYGQIRRTNTTDAPMVTCMNGAWRRVGTGNTVTANSATTTSPGIGGRHGFGDGILPCRLTRGGRWLCVNHLLARRWRLRRQRALAKLPQRQLLDHRAGSTHRQLDFPSARCLRLLTRVLPFHPRLLFLTGSDGVGVDPRFTGTSKPRSFSWRRSRELPR